MRIIARMNVGGPAVQVSGLMRGFDQNIFDQRLFTGYCAGDEADYLELIAPDIPVTRIEGLGRSIKAKDDLLVLFRLMGEIRKFKPNYIHTEHSCQFWRFHQGDSAMQDQRVEIAQH